MAKRRKTAEERRSEKEEAARKVWRSFHTSVTAITNRDSIMELRRSCPLPGKPGRAYYSNFFFLIDNSIVPGSSKYDEWILYMSVIRILSELGYFDSQKAEAIRAELQKKIERLY